MWASTSAASASWGTHFFETKLVDSMTGSPASASWSISDTLTSVGTCLGGSRKEAAPQAVSEHVGRQAGG